MTTWLEQLDEFAWFPSTFDEVYEDLANLAEKEDWDYHFSKTEHKNLFSLTMLGTPIKG